jgi:hypothetical protein
VLSQLLKGSHGMKFFQQRLGSPGATLRLAALLIVITLSLVASKLAEDHFVQNLRKDCSSLFNDRLIPATTLFHLSDAVYRKRDALVQHLRDPSAGASKSIDYQLGQQDAVIDQHIDTIERTYLVEAETQWLRKLHDSLTGYAKIERDLLSRQAAGAHIDRSPELDAAFDELRTELLNLTRVQQVVGQELKSDSLASATNLTTLLYFQLGIAFALGSLASGLAMSLRVPSRPSTSEKLH